MNAGILNGAAAITPGLQVPDPLAAYWLSQVHIRVRREIGWSWHQRLGRDDPWDGSLPPVTECSSDVLDWVRFADHKRRFLQDDPASEHLGACLDDLRLPDQETGAWAFAVRTLALDEAAQFVLALGVSQHLDGGLAPVFAACANDLRRPFPTAALAQRLWDDPAAIARILVDDHALFRSGLLRLADGDGFWLGQLSVAAQIANVLVGYDGPGQELPSPVADPRLHRLDGDPAVLADSLAQRHPATLEIIPLRGAPGADFSGWAGALTAATGRPLWVLPERVAVDPAALCERTTLAWLSGADLLFCDVADPGARSLEAAALRCLSHGVRWFLPVHGTHAFATLPEGVRLPDVTLPSLTYEQRHGLLLDGLGAAGARLSDAVAECARRFRLEAPAVRRITTDLRTAPGLSAERLAAACRAATEDRHDEAAQRLTPRFTAADLVLPAAQTRQFHEIRNAMRMLTEVHYGWGTARVWNEAGLAVLFCGPPGTGKTMAAEALAGELDLDLYRIDLSQVVNKYVGETEKNLRRVFDAAEASDTILFFDEADALFGKRTDVREAHDRFANIEVSYLLERMERFKGLAILATNRRKDLDEAFMRRLRYVVEFPMPGEKERERIWRAAIPARVDGGTLDFRFLARQFAFSGGHIRSVIFNACLQAASRPTAEPLPRGKAGRLTMRDVLVQVQRELEKLNRATGVEQFGGYADSIGEWTA